MTKDSEIKVALQEIRNRLAGMAASRVLSLEVTDRLTDAVKAVVAVELQVERSEFMSRPERIKP